ncbi:hypothetical protein Acsp03_66500 [Actinomadura sp. NBRC 104412]|uniref:hypothetical protein n=1 Tax=Actinomadura sp. NBRC 104412 TaxID=3032203 RepID=UPI0024A3EA58|nr:hypothetical protein [Actinomadura sp. NBRC 104412]GLZ09184.1 hypothetical protein Acsp03_66500 [Actinomadura sp. NBRC 104412]
MGASQDEEAAEEGSGTPQVFTALPARTDDGRALFLRCLADVVRAIDLAVEPEWDPDDQRRWRLSVRAALHTACQQGLMLPDGAFDVLIKAAVYDPDPSFNRQFIEPALNAFGRRRVRSALLDYLRMGTDLERAGAARAWYWSALPLQLHNIQAESSRTASQVEPDDRSVLAQEWFEAALREFVNNEHLDVRRCILPGLPLWRSAYPPELHHLVDTAVAIARSHPDEYIRHRVEAQVHG